jgi:NAD+ synthase (glutamine-hydrolysing)
MDLSLTLAQIDPMTGDVRGNAELIAEVYEAERDVADLVIFPELALTGYCILDLVEVDAFVDRNRAALEDLAERTGETAAIVGFVDRDGEDRYNAAAVLQRGEIRGIARKTLLPNYRYFDDERYFEAAESVEPIPVDVGGGRDPAGTEGGSGEGDPDARASDSTNGGPRDAERANAPDRIDLGLAICEDMWDADYDRKPIPELAAGGADLIVDVSASPFEVAKRLDRDETIRRHVADTGLPFVYLNTAGGADVGKNVVVFDGDSLVYDAGGRLVGSGERFAEDRIAVDLAVGGDAGDAGSVVDGEGTDGSEATGGDGTDGSEATGGDGTDGSEATGGDGTAGGGVGEPAVERVRRERELYEALVCGLRAYAHKSGFETLIEPVSGGIDSALGLALCVEAYGADDVVAYNLPSRVNSETTRDLAAAVADNLGVEYRVVPIQSIYEAVVDAYEEHVGEIESGTARENVYARARALLLMLASNDAPEDAPAMLVSNGNETEMALGYVTLYGDMAGGVGLLGDLTKPDVYDVAAYANERRDEAAIPERAFEIAPSAELSPGQVDPFDYPVVSPIVTELFEERRGPAAIVERFEDRDLDVERYGGVRDGETVYDRYDAASFRDLVFDTYRRMRNSTFKRVQAPPVVAVSERAFGTDFREPIVNGWDGR